MGVPAFYRWLSEKYPKVVQDVLEERVKLVSDDGTMRLPFDSTRPNPSGLETDNFYIDMNGIIHPCSHPENGPQPSTEAEMYENVCRYVDRLFRVVRPRKLLYLAIDGVAPRAKMNQQRSRRFRSAQEAREHAEIEEHLRQELLAAGQEAPPAKKIWDSNVITPGTPFMIRLAEYVRFYIRKRISTDKAWRDITVIFSDASHPGEGEHKIMEHIRLQRSQPGYNPNTVHVLHGLDADLIMLALATHEIHFYILREVVTFGHRSIEAMEKRQLESGFKAAQQQLNEDAGPAAMTLPENMHKQMQRVSIPILREYLANEFASCLSPTRLPFPPSLERLIDDIVFLCFFVGNDFLPHLPSLDIRDGALDYLYNVYKRILPSLGDYITNHGGQVNLSRVDVILAEVGAIEDYVFSLKHENEMRDQRRREEIRERRKKGRNVEAPPVVKSLAGPKPKAMGRAARILEKQEKAKQEAAVVALGRGHAIKEEQRKIIKASHMELDQNAKAALELKRSMGFKVEEEPVSAVKKDETVQDTAEEATDAKETAGKKRKLDQVQEEVVDDDQKSEEEAEFEDNEDGNVKDSVEDPIETEESAGQKRKLDDIKEEAVDGEDEFEEEEAEIEDDDEEDEVEGEIEAEIEQVEILAEVSPEVAERFKNKIKATKEKQLDEFAQNVEDKVRLHEKGWKNRYYSDKCKADDVSAHGGREHMYRCYVVGLCWVMKYYYDGCPSWKWYYPFHYAPFASDLRNIERFQKDCDSFELNEPFKPVEQLMAVLPEDSAHAIPKASQWLMCDEESPIIDFYPKDVPVDPNGKAMPWLWVVLLPFIDEERLLAAMLPTMAKWTPQELLCNAQGLDNGLLYVHTSKPLTEKLSGIFKDKEKYKKSKLRLKNPASFDGSTALFGSVRLPLSNELYDPDEDITIEPPSSARRISRASFDHLFSDAIDPNAAVCFAFSEPPKLSHKSVVLPGARAPKAQLRAEDLRIRRPRLNRGGMTIANMGGSKNGASHQSGYGSMNIGSYERSLAEQTGRGNQMYQTGTRAWGAMEPMPKRRQHGGVQHPPYPSNPFNQGQIQSAPGRQPNNNRPPWQSGGNAQRMHPGYTAQPVPPHQQGYPQHQFNRQGGLQQSQQQPYQQQSRPGSGQQHARRGGYQQRPPPPPPPPPPSHGHSFQGYNRSAPQGQYPGYAQSRPQHQSQPPPRVNASVMNSLRSQLASTLQQSKRGRGQNDSNKR